MTIEESISGFTDYIATERRMAAGTVRNYTGDLHDLAEHLAAIGVVELHEMTARDVRSWQMTHTERGEAPGTIKRRLSSVGSWLRWLRSNGLYDADLMVKITYPKQPKRTPVFYREPELEHLYDAGLFPTDFVGQRDALILRILYETGIRRAELIGLKEHAVDTTALTIKVLGKRNKERIIPIETELAGNISSYIALKRQEVGETEWLFTTPKGKQMTAGQVYYLVKKYMTMLSTADRISPHVFRHSFATHILKEGGDLLALKELLGHENLATTEIYTHITREQLKQTYQHTHPRGRKK
ncbi:MAG: tyrosine-type recombinase/integrase [Bacteroidales bacterium]|nr:tyrosine-type recombinase/integrase [Bacteroidales bacterium]